MNVLHSVQLLFYDDYILHKCPLQVTLIESLLPCLTWCYMCIVFIFEFFCATFFYIAFIHFENDQQNFIHAIILWFHMIPVSFHMSQPNRIVNVQTKTIVLPPGWVVFDSWQCIRASWMQRQRDKKNFAEKGKGEEENNWTYCWLYLMSDDQVNYMK